MNTKISVVIVMVIMLFICSQGNIVNAETVKIDTNRFKTVVIEKGKSAKLCNLSMKKIKWKSTNKKVATVNKKGLVKAKKIGTVNITDNTCYFSLLRAPWENGKCKALRL